MLLENEEIAQISISFVIDNHRWPPLMWHEKAVTFNALPSHKKERERGGRKRLSIARILHFTVQR